MVEIVKKKILNTNDLNSLEEVAANVGKEYSEVVSHRRAILTLEKGLVCLDNKKTVFEREYSFANGECQTALSDINYALDKKEEFTPEETNFIYRTFVESQYENVKEVLDLRERLSPNQSGAEDFASLIISDVIGNGIIFTERGSYMTSVFDSLNTLKIEKDRYLETNEFFNYLRSGRESNCRYKEIKRYGYHENCPSSAATLFVSPAVQHAFGVLGELSSSHKFDKSKLKEYAEKIELFENTVAPQNPKLYTKYFKELARMG